MKAERRHELKENSLVRGVQNFPQFWRDYGSKISLALILALLTAVLVRLWLSNREQERVATAEQLTSARAVLEQFRRGEAGSAVLQDADAETLAFLDFMSRNTGNAAIPVGQLPPETAAKVRKDVWARVEQAANEVLKSTDPARQAEAKLLQADANLHWGVLATLGDVPAAATRPTLAIGGKPDEYLDRAKQSYQQLVDQAANVPPRVVAAARMGLAAVGENRGDFAEARKQYDEVRKNGPDQTTKSLAEARLNMLARQAVNPLIGPPKSSETQPATGPATVPATMAPAATAPMTQSDAGQAGTTAPGTNPSATAQVGDPAAAVGTQPTTVPTPTTTTTPAAAAATSAPAGTQPATQP